MECRSQQLFLVNGDELNSFKDDRIGEQRLPTRYRRSHRCTAAHKMETIERLSDGIGTIAVPEV